MKLHPRTSIGLWFFAGIIAIIGGVSMWASNMGDDIDWGLGS